MDAGAVREALCSNEQECLLDAEAIAEAMQRPRMRFVPIQTEEQLDLQALHRVRERWVMRRTAVVNRSAVSDNRELASIGLRHVSFAVPKTWRNREGGPALDW
jgi:transposase